MKKLLFLFLLCTLLLSSCSMPGASFSASGAQAWLDQPVNGAILPLGAFPLKAHARHVEGSGITRIEFLVNGVPVGAVDTDPAAPLAYAEVTWNASAPGEYKVMARAYAGGEVADSAPAMVCVSEEAQVPVLSYVPGCQVPPIPAKPQQGSTETPSPKVTETISPKVTDTPKPTDTPWPTDTPRPTDTPWPTNTPYYPPTNTPYYPPTNTPVPPDTTPPVVDITRYTLQVGYGSSCSRSESILEVVAIAQDYQTGIERVTVLLEFDRGRRDEIRMSSNDGYYYSAQIDLNSMNLYDLYGGANGHIYITVFAYDRAGNRAQVGPFTVSLYNCIG